MASTPEGTLKLKIKGYLNFLGPLCFWFMPMMMGYGKKGIPDFVGCYNGWFFTIETKVEGKKEKPWQEQRGEEIEAAKGLRIKTNSLEEVIQIFQTKFGAPSNAVQQKT